MRVCVIGASGQLGSDICKVFGVNDYEVFPFSHDDIEIKDFESSLLALRDRQPDIIINTAAMHHVEKCELNPSGAFSVNGLGARNLALLSNELGACLIHISTDYVFDGLKKRPYTESDCPAPLNVYGNTKLCGEHFIRSLSQKFFIIRTSAIYGENPCRAKQGMNFIRLMLHLSEQGKDIRVVDDEIVGPTHTLDIAHQLIELVGKTDAYGLYHVTSQGNCSWYQFAKEVFRLADKKVSVERADPSEFPSKINRPKYSVLENKRLKDLNLDIMPDWQDALKFYMESLRSP